MDEDGQRNESTGISRGCTVVYSGMSTMREV